MTTTIPTRRKCATFDCDRPARPNGFFCTDACRARTWKRNHPEYQSPPSPKQRQIAAERPSRVSNGGLQVSVGRMLTVLQGEPFWMTEHHASVGRNDPCPCESGRKFKKCCGRAA
jgi:hypothetical protein